MLHIKTSSVRDVILQAQESDLRHTMLVTLPLTENFQSSNEEDKSEVGNGGMFQLSGIIIDHSGAGIEQIPFPMHTQ